MTTYKTAKEAATDDEDWVGLRRLANHVDELEAERKVREQKFTTEHPDTNLRTELEAYVRSLVQSELAGSTKSLAATVMLGDLLRILAGEKGVRY